MRTPLLSISLKTSRLVLSMLLVPHSFACLYVLLLWSSVNIWIRLGFKATVKAMSYNLWYSKTLLFQMSRDHQRNVNHPSFQNNKFAVTSTIMMMQDYVLENLVCNSLHHNSYLCGGKSCLSRKMTIIMGTLRAAVKAPPSLRLIFVNKMSIIFPNSSFLNVTNSCCCLRAHTFTQDNEAAAWCWVLVQL